MAKLIVAFRNFANAPKNVTTADEFIRAWAKIGYKYCSLTTTVLNVLLTCSYFVINMILSL